MVSIVVRLADLDFLSPLDLSGELSPAQITEAIRWQFDCLPGETFTGLQLMCLMHAGFKRIAPEHDTGMDLDAPFLTALELFQKGQD